jgi:hypothetical protein
MKNALIIGINDYGNPKNNLNCCVNDANKVASLLEFNDDGSRNFSIIKLLDEEATYDNIEEKIKVVFNNDSDISIFYFSGHGFDDENDGRICTYDYRANHMGIRFRDILELIERTKCKNKIIILDCCHAGKIGNFSMIGDNTVLACGTTILTACNVNEYSIEINGHGLFTKLLIDALEGGASDIFGRISPGSIYSYIDSSLGNFDQRPLFKSYVKSFVTVRTANSKMGINEMRNLMKCFKEDTSLFQLDPSFEPMNFPDSKGIGPEDLTEPYFKPENGKVFALLQKAVSNGLVKPSNEKHMYWAALHSDTCCLTSIGKHYWWLVNKEII